jgi:hypothetical protein
MAESDFLLEYQPNRDDRIAFSLHHSRNSAPAKKARVIVIIACMVTGFLTPPYSRIGWRIAMAILLPTLYLLANRIITPWYVRRAHSEGRDRVFNGVHRLVLQESGLHAETDVSVSDVRYEALERVVEVSSHVFVLVSATSAIVIPRSRIIRGDLAAFVGELKRRLQRR